MKIQLTLNMIGLVFDVLGVSLLFFYGPPAPKYTRDGYPILPFNSNNPKEEEENKRQANKEFRISKLALWSLILGFLFQLTSNVIQLYKS